MDGGLQQLIELLVTGYVSLACYLVFKSCEYTLVRHLSEARQPDQAPGLALEQDRNPE